MVLLACTINDSTRRFFLLIHLSYCYLILVFVLLSSSSNAHSNAKLLKHNETKLKYERKNDDKKNEYE